jgi:hypothetical protein
MTEADMFGDIHLEHARLGARTAPASGPRFVLICVNPGERRCLDGLRGRAILARQPSSRTLVSNVDPRADFVMW